MKIVFLLKKSGFQLKGNGVQFKENLGSRLKKVDVG